MSGFWIRRLHQAGAHSGWVFPFHRKVLRQRRSDNALVLVRVDDYPRWDRPLSEFVAFDRMLERHGVAYAIGVTPFIGIHPRQGRLERDEIETLQQLVTRGVTLAQHGFTHKPHVWHRRYTVELPAYSAQEIAGWIARSDDFYAQSDLPRPEIMIPPFDGITIESFLAVSDRYTIVTGGPASLTTLGPVAPGVRLHRSVYLPSYYPHMYPTRMYERLGERLWRDATGPVVVLTLHWAWEVRDGYRRLKPLLSALEGRAVPWGSLLRRLAPNNQGA